MPYTLLSDSFEAAIGHVLFSVCFIRVHLQRLRHPPRALHNTPPAMPRSHALRPAFPSLRLLSRARARIRNILRSSCSVLCGSALVWPSVSARLLQSQLLLFSSSPSPPVFFPLLLYYSVLSASHPYRVYMMMTRSHMCFRERFAVICMGRKCE